MPDDLVNLTIDGVAVSVPKGTLVIEAAKQAGVLVPHYCYHPGLAGARGCRLCPGGIEKAPKLQNARATPGAGSMVRRHPSAPGKNSRMGGVQLLLLQYPTRHSHLR